MVNKKLKGKPGKRGGRLGSKGAKRGISLSTRSAKPSRTGFKGGRKITKKQFTSGFQKKSFLGSAFPSVRSASMSTRVVGNASKNTFKEIDKQMSRPRAVKKF